MKLAIIQDGPEYFDLKKTVEKTHDLLADAASRGADVVVFGECWLTGYPVWLDICSDMNLWDCLLYTSPSPRDATLSRMPSSA